MQKKYSQRRVSQEKTSEEESYISNGTTVYLTEDRSRRIMLSAFREEKEIRSRHELITKLK